ncbi:uncharacterized protein BDZ99DRAFT_572061 [Mytilinidion resinicola]|uniref:Zn(2)-C6 fungal-type domain-containing protein n=1 Tax=Mytilinidion resinicola TaxID=574789 RepID=A0A6A6YHV8_9PEZI|nr:uncharacterized protein BDZ99DRAFT_572061 [Mytilinidion resinicola]KAF2808159.1 hypothetical protein BDZ99DRAFT_572061 [Mytilinidion resinicola]
MASTPPNSQYPSPLSQSPEFGGPPKRAPKLRASCDLCAAAKVKCSKEHPSCIRCTSNGHECVYGPSRKHGKPGRKRKPKPENKAAAKSIANWVSSLGKDQFPEVQLALESLMNGEDQFSWNSNPGVPAPEPEPARDASFSLMADSPLNCPEPAGSVRIGSDTTTNSMMHPFTKSKELHGGISLTPPASFDYQNFNDFIGGDDLPSLDASLNTTAFQNPGLNSTLLPDSPITDDSAYGSCRTSLDSSNHNCCSLACNTMESLSHDSTCFGPQSSSSIFSQRTRSSSQTLDSVLHNNKAAIATVSQLLNCPCAHLPHQAMLYASIVFKVLHWYQIASGVKASTPMSTGTFMASSPNFMPTPSPPRIGSSAPGNIMFMPMTIGAFSLDEEDQEAFRQQLLLSELRKVGQLIDTFASRGSEECDSGKLYRSVGILLREEWACTVSDIRER